MREQQIPLNSHIQLAITSNIFCYTNYATMFFPLREWFAHTERIEAILNHLAKRLNSGENLNIHDGFEVAVLFAHMPEKGGKGGGVQKNPGRKCWKEK